MNYTELMKSVIAAINKRFDIEPGKINLDYPGFISIPESIISDESDSSDRVWAVGPDDLEDDAWSGQLMTADGSDQIRHMAFVVYPKSNDPDVIADAIYTHGIGDLYIGGGCADQDCPRRK